MQQSPGGYNFLTQSTYFPGSAATNYTLCLAESHAREKAPPLFMLLSAAG